MTCDSSRIPEALNQYIGIQTKLGLNLLCVSFRTAFTVLLQLLSPFYIPNSINHALCY